MTLDNQSQTERMSTQTPNYFELLDLDPNAKWDDEAFDRALTLKKAEWTKRARHPKYATLYHSYLDMVPTIIAVMSDAAQRDAQAKAALANRLEQQQQLQVQYNDELELLTAKGFVTEDDIAALAKRYAVIFAADDIRQSLKRRNLDIRESEADAERIDGSTLRTMEGHLAVLNKSDLYDFLGMPKTAPTMDLFTAGQNVYEATQRKATKTAEVTAQAMLAGYAMRFFKDETQRQAYDVALADRAYEETLGVPLLRLLQSGDKMLYAGQFQKLLESARVNGLDLDRAKDYVFQRAKQLGAAIEIVDAAPVKAQRVCPNCATLNDERAKVCTSCGTPLEMTCPGCGNTILTEHNFCVHCNFPIGDLFLIQHRLDLAFDLLRDRQYALAEERLSNAWYLWNQLPERAFKNSMLTDMEWRFNQAEEEVQWQQAKLSQLRDFIDNKHFYAARDLLRTLQSELGENALAKQQQLIESTLTDVEARLKQARTVDNDAAVAMYVNILHDCADCQSARDELARIPPAPPTDLNVNPGTDVIYLEWQPSTSKDVRYIVVRKAGSMPTSAKDGVELTRTTGTRYDDAAPENGLPLFYVIYAERGGVLSLEHAPPDAYAQLAAPIDGLTSSIDNARVNLAWQTPPNVSGVVIQRSTENYPQHPFEGDTLPVINLSQATDTAVENGRAYHYSVFCQYKDAYGEAVFSTPKTISVTPQEPPTFIESLEADILRTGPKHSLRLRFVPPEKGDAAVLVTTKPPDVYTHQIVPAKQITRQGEVVYGSAGEVQVTVEAAQIVYFTPLVLFGGMAYVGATLDYASLEDVKKLELKNLGKDLQLRWEWPRNCDKVIVAFSHTHFPTARDQTDVTRIEFTRAQYQRAFFTLRDAARLDYYFAVFAVIQQDGQELMASGYNARARISLSAPVEVRYSIQRERKIFGTPTFVLHISTEGTGSVPDMVLARQKHAPPHTRSAGEVIVHVRGAKIREGGLKVELPESAIQEGCYAGLFLVDENLYESRGGHVRIMNPAIEMLKVW